MNTSSPPFKITAQFLSRSQTNRVTRAKHVNLCFSRRRKKICTTWEQTGIALKTVSFQDIDPDSTGAMPRNKSAAALEPSYQKQRVHFNMEVVQFIAVEEEPDIVFSLDDVESSDDEMLLMKAPPARRSIRLRSPSRTGFKNETKIIAPLPSTTLSDAEHTPELSSYGNHGRWLSDLKLLSPSAPDTLRSPRPQASSIIGNEAHRVNLNLQPKLTGNNCRHGTQPIVSQEQHKQRSRKLHLTTPHMSKPCGDVVPGTNSGVLGKVGNAANTAKDIAFVLWNVGW
jgi:hypothetical protein